MNESGEFESAADEGESAREMQTNSYDGVAGLFDSPAPPTAASTTETIDSREEVHYCNEWELFSDTTSDQRDASDSEDSTDDCCDAEVGQPTPQQTTTNTTDISIEAVLVLERSQQDDTDRQESTDEDPAPRSTPREASPSTCDDGSNLVPCSGSSSSDRPNSQCETAGMRRRIQVVVRVRPPSDPEGKVAVTEGEKEGNSLCVQATASQGSISTVTECAFDRVFMGDASQEDVFTAIEPSVQACLDGYNATVFAYGQTGTGKTHTLFGRDLGSPSDNGEVQEGNDSSQRVKSTWGIVPRTLSYLLGQTSILKEKNCQLELHLSFLQIYNDRLFDLLTDRMRQKPLLVREQPTLDGTTSVTVRGLSNERITSFSSAMQIIQQGHTNRCVRETESNMASSRSHAIVQIHVMTQCPAPNGEGQILRKARLNLVDLAGSEKWNTDVEMEDAHSQELKNINTSLSALGNCIAALTEAGRKHIPYRDSTLTRVLQDSFGGNTQSCLIATVNATQQSCDETIRTLHFADRARSVMQTIRVNEVADGSTELLMAKVQIVKLRERLDSEQRRRHETRLKEHQAMQHDFQEKLKGKDKEIMKLTRDNAVFQRWRDEDVKKIRTLEGRVKDLEQQVGSGDGKNSEPLTNSASSMLVQVPKRQSAVSASISATKQTPVKKTRSRANLTRVGSDNGTAARTHKQVIERYTLGPIKGQQAEAAQPSKVAFDQAQQSDPSYDVQNQLEEFVETQRAASDLGCSVNQKARWETGLIENRVGGSLDLGRPDVTRYQGSQLCVSPVNYRSSEPAASPAHASNTQNSWAYSNIAATAASFSTEWASLMMSKSTPAILIQQRDNNKKGETSTPASGCNSSLLKQELGPLLKNASTGSLSYNSPVRVFAAIEPCQKHKLAGCMLCSVGDSLRQAQAAPVRQPSKELTSSSVTSKITEMTRKPQDGPCERHQLLRCFICMKNSNAATSTAPATTAAASTAVYNYGISASTSSSKTISYQNSTIQGEIQSKCALHSLANCILCAGVKAMTRKAPLPSPQASPLKTTYFDARNHVEDRYRRYTLDERILNYQGQSKLANQW